MGKFFSAFITIGIIVIVLIFGGAFYIVNESEQVVITQFGKPVGDPVTEPGLKIKKPFLETANYFDKRFLAWDGEPKQVSTRDKRFININTYARWRISDPLQYAKRLFDESKALTRLGSVLEGATQNAIANHDLIELVRSSNREYVGNNEEDNQQSSKEKTIIKNGRDELTREILNLAKESTKDLGIEILDFQFKRINYVPEVRKKVYERMISERKRIAEEFRSQGAGQAARISGQKDRDLKEITSDAYRRSQEIKGRADAKAANIYAAAYNKDPSFYRFMKTMEVYKKTLDKETVLVLSTDGEFLKYLSLKNEK
jgi:membrane protease subunit HflC